MTALSFHTLAVTFPLFHSRVCEGCGKFLSVFSCRPTPIDAILLIFNELITGKKSYQNKHSDAYPLDPLSVSGLRVRQDLLDDPPSSQCTCLLELFPSTHTFA